MVDTAPPPEPIPTDETPTQKQARLRREKRNAKLAATGTDRLAKIKQLNGGVAPPDEVLGGPAAPQKPQSRSASSFNATVDDPDEVDISDHPYTPGNVSGTGTPQSATANVDPLMQAMMQMQAQQQSQGQSQDQGQQAEDPMAQMMQQMMGMMGGDPNNPNAGPSGGGDPLQMLSTMMGAMNGGKVPQTAPANSSAYLWRVVHAISALLIAGYITLTSTFNGSALARTSNLEDFEAGGLGPRLFWMFATVEVTLQSTRYFVEKGQLQGSGWLAKIANSGFVPEPYAQYIRTIGRYSTIYTTVVSDAMVVVFVLGCLAWWRGVAEV